MKYLKDCKQDCSHIHILPIYHLSLGAHNSHHGSFGRGISEGQIDCRSVPHAKHLRTREQTGLYSPAPFLPCDEYIWPE